MASEKGQWPRRIEVGNSFLELVLNAIQLTSLIITALGIIFAYFSDTTTGARWPFINIKWAIILIGMAFIFLVVSYLMKTIWQERKPVLTNPALWIERDELAIKVHPNGREVERRYDFKAKKSVDRYRFKLRWSGTKEVKIDLVGTDDGLSRVTGPRVQWEWHRYEVFFKQPLNAGERKTLVVRYDLPDDKKTAQPHHLVSYAHVLGCSKLILRLAFPEDNRRRDVYLIQYDANWEVVEGLPLGRDVDDHEYRIEVNVKPGIKYSLEWQEVTA